MRPAIPLHEMTEKQWQQQVVALARTLGWRSYHTLRSKGSQPGYPDLTLVRDRVIFLELKTETGTVTDKQREWLKALNDADAEVYVVRPRHLEQLAILFGPAGNTMKRAEARAVLLVELDRIVDPETQLSLEDAA